MSTVTDPPARLREAPGPAAQAKIPFSSRLSATSFGLLLVAPVALLLIAIVIYPVGYSFYLSLTHTNPVSGVRRLTGLANYRTVLGNADFWHSAILTAFYVGCVTVLAAAIALGMALLLRERFLGRPILMAVTVLPWSLSTYAAAVVWRYMYSPQYGLLASISQHLGRHPIDFLSKRTVIPALALVHAWQFAPLGTYFLLASLQAIPEDLYKLGKVDGMGMLRRFRIVTLPYIRMPFAIYLVLVGGQAAMAFDLIYFLTSGGPGGSSQTLTYDVYRTTFQDRNFGPGAAMSWILLIVVTVVTTGYYVIVMSPRLRRGKGATS